MMPVCCEVVGPYVDLADLGASSRHAPPKSSSVAAWGRNDAATADTLLRAGTQSRNPARTIRDPLHPRYQKDCS